MCDENRQLFTAKRLYQLGPSQSALTIADKHSFCRKNLHHENGKSLTI